MTLGLYSVALAVARGIASQGSGVNKQFANLVTIPGSIYRTEQICSVSFPALSGKTGNMSRTPRTRPSWPRPRARRRRRSWRPRRLPWPRTCWPPPAPCRCSACNVSSCCRTSCSPLEVYVRKESHACFQCKIYLLS